MAFLTMQTLVFNKQTKLEKCQRNQNCNGLKQLSKHIEVMDQKTGLKAINRLWNLKKCQFIDDIKIHGFITGTDLELIHIHCKSFKTFEIKRNGNSKIIVSISINWSIYRLIKIFECLWVLYCSYTDFSAQKIGDIVVSDSSICACNS